MRRIDLKDRRILYHLDVDPRTSNSEIAKKTGLSKDVVNYRIKRLEDDGIIRWYGVVPNTYKLGILKIKIYLTLRNETEEIRQEIITYFCDHAMTEWVARLSGRWDLVIGYLSEDIYQFNEALFDFMHKYSVYVDDKAITLALGVYNFKKDWLLYNRREKFPSVYQSGKKERVSFDDVDDELCKILTNNARLPLVKLAEKVQQSPQTVRSRIDNLKKANLISSSKIYLDLAKLGKLFYKAHVYLQNTTEEKVKSLIHWCELNPEITYIVRNIGPWELEIEFEIDSFQQFYKIMQDLKYEFREIVRSYDYSTIIKDYQWDYYPGCYKSFI